MISINPEAMEIARALDTERKEKGVRGPLHGISIILKDNYDTKDLFTTGGTDEWETRFNISWEWYF